MPYESRQMVMDLFSVKKVIRKFQINASFTVIKSTDNLVSNVMNKKRNIQSKVKSLILGCCMLCTPDCEIFDVEVHPILPAPLCTASLFAIPSCRRSGNSVKWKKECCMGAHLAAAE